MIATITNAPVTARSAHVSMAVPRSQWRRLATPQKKAATRPEAAWQRSSWAVETADVQGAAPRSCLPSTASPTKTPHARASATMGRTVKKKAEYRRVTRRISPRSRAAASRLSRSPSRSTTDVAASAALPARGDARSRGPPRDPAARVPGAAHSFQAGPAPAVVLARAQTAGSASPPLSISARTASVTRCQSVVTSPSRLRPRAVSR